MEEEETISTERWSLLQKSATAEEITAICSPKGGKYIIA
jgi:hypothetical protein